jgi:UDP-GlcNAc:undecaprenyl-phosphate/decaprenyl-phosphate GlcNAc-1-phosphate transferase
MNNFNNNEMLIFLTILIIFSFIMALTSTWYMRKLAAKNNWVAPQRADRWHTRPTALHGGVGFFPVIAFGMLFIFFKLLIDIDFFNNWKFTEELKLFGATLCGSIIMFLLGWADDIKQYKPSTKIIAQLISTSLFVFAGGAFQITNIIVIDILVTYFWFIGIINAINMLDNMDGLSSGIVLIASITLALLSIYNTPQIPLSVPIGLILASVLFAFLQFNCSPATIFMGDSGSLSIGFLLAALAVPTPLNAYLGIPQTDQSVTHIITLLIPAVVISVPIFDTTFVSISRKWRGRKATQGGQDHSSHRLVLVGLTDKQAVKLLYSLSIAGGIIALLMQRYTYLIFPLIVLFCFMMGVIGVYLGRLKVQETNEKNSPHKLIPILSQLLHKRHAVEVLLDTIFIITCFYAAHLLRFDGILTLETIQTLEESLPIIVSICLLSFFFLGVYRGQWRLISAHDIPRMLISVITGVIGSAIFITIFTNIAEVFSLSIFFIFSILLFLSLSGSRISFKILDALFQPDQKHLHKKDTKNVLIYGAGKNGKVLQEVSISNFPTWNLAVIGFVDDDENKTGRMLQGLPVLTGKEWINRNVKFDELWIASPIISDQLVSQITDAKNKSILVRKLQFKLDPKPENSSL